MKKEMNLKMHPNNLFLLNWKRFLFILALAVISIILHNVISALIGVEEAFFFILVIFVLPIYIVIAIVYTLIHYLKITL